MFRFGVLSHLLGWRWKTLPGAHRVKPGLHISGKDRKHLVANRFLSFGLHIVVMIAGIHISQEIFANDIFTVSKRSLEHDRKHVLRLLRRIWKPGFKAWFSCTVIVGNRKQVQAYREQILRKLDQIPFS